MGQHRHNPTAQALASVGPRKEVQVMPLGEDVVLLGVMLRPVIDTFTDELVIRLEMAGGLNSPVIGLLPQQVPVGELARLPLKKVRAVFKGEAPSAVEPGVPAPVEVGDSPAEIPAGGSPLIIINGGDS